MKKKALILLSVLMLFFTFSASKASATDKIAPIDKVYTSGIYQLNTNPNENYNLMYHFLDENKQSAIIVLDGNYDITYKNINCHRKCNAGTITSKNTIIIVGESEVALYFEKTT